AVGAGGRRKPPAPGGGRAARATRPVLARRRGLLLDGARWAQAAKPRARLEPGPSALVAGSTAAAGRGCPRRPYATGDVLRLGHPVARLERAVLQPGRLPRRLGLATRLRADRVRIAQVRLRRGLHSDLRGTARGRLARPGLPPARA